MKTKIVNTSQPTPTPRFDGDVIYNTVFGLEFSPILMVTDGGVGFPGVFDAVVIHVSPGPALVRGGTGTMKQYKLGETIKDVEVGHWLVVPPGFTIAFYHNE